MASRVTQEEYAAAVAKLIPLAKQPTGTGKVVAQVLLSAYNGYDYQLNIVDLSYLEKENHDLVMTVIQGRYDTGKEPHTFITNGGDIFVGLWHQWHHLHVEERGKKDCANCNGHGVVYQGADDDGVPCTPCGGTGRVCRCS